MRRLDTGAVGDLRARVERLGVVWQGKRFEIYQRDLAYHSEPSPEFVASFKASSARQRLTFEAGSQLFQLQLAAHTWDGLDRSRLKGTLKEIFEGPAIDPGTDDRPRNKLLELVAASCFSGAFGVELTKDFEDLRLTHPDIGPGAVECKRPTTLEAIRSNLIQAGIQLRAREKQRGSRFGVVVIGADRIAGLANEAREEQTYAEANRALHERAAETEERVRAESKDQSVGICPEAVYGVVLLPCAPLVRKPWAEACPILVVRPVLLLEKGSRPDIEKAFAECGAALSDFRV